MLMESYCESSKKTLLRGACYLCSAHGVEAYQRSHICPFSACECTNCKVIRVRRTVVARQLRMRREEKKLCENSLRAYTCNRCRNHGIRIPKKGHKNECPYDSCSCPMCTLCHSRSILDANFRRSTGRSLKKVSKSASPELLTLDEEVVSSRLSRVHSASPDPFPLNSSTSDITSISVGLSLSNPFLVTTQSLSLIPSGIVTIPNSFDSENISPWEHARVRFLLQSLPQSLQALIGFHPQL